MRVGDADLRIGAPADLARQHEGADARQVGLVGQRQQVHHQLGVLGVIGRHADRLLDHRQLARVLRFGHLDAALDVAHRLEVLVDLRLVLRAEGAPQPPDLVADEIEDAAIALIRSSRARASVLPVVPNSRSKTARGSFSIGSGVVGVRHAMVFV